MRFNQTHVEVGYRLYNRDKEFIASLLLNGYDSTNHLCDVLAIMHYASSEPALMEDILTFMKVMSRGVETHELIGRDNVINMQIKYGSKYYPGGSEEYIKRTEWMR
ncbi:hypothetical protein CBP31_03010 [Oceanisphaera profunda]|uniref:Uncharacterized protein n=1 Tax=Oceanisphaera profunda TaxID=1416627 RepID=A0A1Y0D2H0_9GAMM|nr:hypothetical protein [Oceanisphaera profunda]ART81721.1 hypothetical protein CBP31_03010 [Oceanisphaera profunda]